ncbi:glycosyltransferase family 4 protein [Aestuariibaculum suncheonense]|uniref:Glycosyltransferase family 4 protein n=1 Tax=Aestuariibaculum suncheonense TaxID=1028745 RepID=A0A8J6QBE0_9FLAO|nr:glycosyltransferase family 4 protein [Aestuariibaculum suncheonense]MBD0837034.1 glycosyltransferase family 4 protein [Aestuariibaculum suncheonense]
MRLNKKAVFNIVIFDGSFETTAFIRRLMQGLVKQGHQMTVLGFNTNNPDPVEGVCYRSLGSNQSKRALITTSLGLVFKPFGLARIFKTIWLIIQGNRKALQEQNLRLSLKTIQPDVVHVQWPSLLPWLESYFENDNFKIVLSQRGFHVNVRPFVNTNNFNYLQNVYPKLDGLHSVSKDISNTGQMIGIPHTGIDQVVYTGIHLDSFAFKAKPDRSDVLQLLSVGRPHWKKDYGIGVKACALLKTEGIRFHYTIIGGSGDEELLYLIHEMGLETEVSLLSHLEQDQVFQYMQDADILLSTSIEEGLANVVVEAMALGTPVISTDCGGMPELITHKEQGWLVPVGNPQVLKQAIMEVQTLTSEHLLAITQAARLKVEQQHSEQVMVSGMENLYEAVLKYECT